MPCLAERVKCWGMFGQPYVDVEFALILFTQKRKRLKQLGSFIPASYGGKSGALCSLSAEE